MGSAGFDYKTPDPLATLIRILVLVIYLLAGIIFAILGVWLLSKGVALGGSGRRVYLAYLDPYTGIPGAVIVTYGVILLLYVVSLCKGNKYFYDYYFTFKTSIDKGTIKSLYGSMARIVFPVADKLDDKTISGLLLMLFSSNFIAVIAGLSAALVLVCFSNLLLLLLLLPAVFVLLAYLSHKMSRRRPVAYHSPAMDNVSMTRPGSSDPVIGAWLSPNGALKTVFHADGSFDIIVVSRYGMDNSYIGGTYQKDSAGRYWIHPETSGSLKENARPHADAYSIFAMDGDRIYNIDDPDMQFTLEKRGLIDGIDRGELPAGRLQWNNKYPLVSDILLWERLMLICGFAGAAMYLMVMGIVWIMPYYNLLSAAICMFPIAAIIMLVLAFVFFLPIALKSILGQGANAIFVMNEEGVGYVLKDFALVGSSFSIIPARYTDEGKFFQSYLDLRYSYRTQNMTFRRILWRDVRSVNVDADGLSIIVKGKPMRMPVRLYCTPDNFDQAVLLIGKNVEPSVIHGNLIRGDHERPARNPAIVSLAIAAVILLAIVLFGLALVGVMSIISLHSP